MLFTINLKKLEVIELIEVHVILGKKYNVRPVKPLDLYSNGIHGFYTSPTGKSFSGRTIKWYEEKTEWFVSIL